MVLLIKGNFLSNWQNKYLSADMVLTGTPHQPYRQYGAATQSYQQCWAEGTFLHLEWLLESSEIAVKGPSRGAMVLNGGAKPPPAMGLAGRVLRQNHNLSLFSCSNVLLPSHPGQSPKKARGQEGLSLDFNLSWGQSKIEKGSEWVRRGRFKTSSTFILSAYSPVVKNLYSVLYSVRSKVIIFSHLSLT